MPDYGPDVSGMEPSWMESGGDLSGGSETGYGFDNDDSYISPRGTVVSAPAWDSTTTSRQNQSPEDTRPGPGCDPGSPPDTGTWIFGVVDGVCQWIDTTDCS